MNKIKNYGIRGRLGQYLVIHHFIIDFDEKSVRLVPGQTGILVQSPRKVGSADCCRCRAFCWLKKSTYAHIYSSAQKSWVKMSLSYQHIKKSTLIHIMFSILGELFKNTLSVIDSRNYRQYFLLNGVFLIV